MSFVGVLALSSVSSKDSRRWLRDANFRQRLSRFCSNFVKLLALIANENWCKFFLKLYYAYAPVANGHYSAYISIPRTSSSCSQSWGWSRVYFTHELLWIELHKFFQLNQLWGLQFLRHLFKFTTSGCVCVWGGGFHGSVASCTHFCAKQM